MRIILNWNNPCQTRLQIVSTSCLAIPPAWSCSCLSSILFESFLLESWSCSRGESDPGLGCSHSSGQVLRPAWNLFWAASISRSATSDRVDPLGVTRLQCCNLNESALAYHQRLLFVLGCYKPSDRGVDTLS